MGSDEIVLYHDRGSGCRTLPLSKLTELYEQKKGKFYGTLIKMQDCSYYLKAKANLYA